MWFRKTSKDSDVVVSSRIRFARSVAGYQFPNKMSSSKLKEIVELVELAINKDKYKIFKMSDIDENTEYSLMEQHLISKEFVGNKDGAIIINSDNTIVTMVNEEDHFRIQSFESGFNVDSCYSKIVEFTNELNEKIEFAIHDKYGYLTSCPTNVGSGMRVSVMLHLPALSKIGLLSKLFDQAAGIGISVRGLYGENTQGIGYMFQISNQKTLGLSDKDIINNIKAVVTSIIEQERKAREILDKTNSELEDDIYRAYGILKYSRIISIEETLKCLSKLRLGISIGMISNITLEKVQTLMVDVEPHTLRIILKDNFTKDEENFKRSEYIRKELD